MPHRHRCSGFDSSCFPASPHRRLHHRRQGGFVTSAAAPILAIDLLIPSSRCLLPGDFACDAFIFRPHRPAASFPVTPAALIGHRHRVPALRSGPDADKWLPWLRRDGGRAITGAGSAGTGLRLHQAGPDYVHPAGGRVRLFFSDDGTDGHRSMGRGADTASVTVCEYSCSRCCTPVPGDGSPGATSPAASLLTLPNWFEDGNEDACSTTLTRRPAVARG